MTALFTAEFGVAPRAVYTGILPAETVTTLPELSTPSGDATHPYIEDVAVSCVSLIPLVPHELLLISRSTLGDAIPIQIPVPVSKICHV